MAVRCAEGEEVEDDGMWATLMYMAPEMFYEWHAHVVKTGGQVSVLLPPLITPPPPHAVPLSPPCTPTCHQVVYGHKVDVWAIGVVAYELLYGTLPFGLGEDPSEDFEVRPRLPNA